MNKLGILSVFLFFCMFFLAVYIEDKLYKVKSNFSIETYENHTYIIYKSSIIHDPDCECGGSDLEAELNLVYKGLIKQ